MEENNLHKLDAIKEIIFGENIKEYDSEFKKLKEEITKQREEARTMVKAMKKEIQVLIKDSDQDFKAQIEELKKEISLKIGQIESSKASKDLLAETFIELGKKLKK